MSEPGRRNIPNNPSVSQRYRVSRKAKVLVALAITIWIGFPGNGKTNEPVIIGDARMHDDGTIIVNLRRTTDGIYLSGSVRYPTSHPNYKEVLAHIGGMRPGEVRLVPDWPDPTPKNQ
jgi:hypothetical protein